MFPVSKLSRHSCPPVARVTLTSPKAGTLTRLALIFLIFAPVSRCQAQFDQVHTLLLELDGLQKSGKHDKPTVDRLNDLMAEVTERAGKLLNSGILALLNSPGAHSAAEINERISTALQILPTGEYHPEVYTFRSASGQGDSYLIAYNVPYCASCSRAWIGLVGRRGDRYEILTDVGKAFSEKSLHVASLTPGEEGGNRFLVYGTNLGDAHSRLTVSAYEVHATKLKSVWIRADLPQGTVEVTPTRISLTFLTRLNPPWKEKTEIYEVLEKKRIKLQGSKERSNP